MKRDLIILAMGGNICMRQEVYAPNEQVSTVAQLCFGAFAHPGLPESFAALLRGQFSGVRQHIVALKNSDELIVEDVANLHQAIAECQSTSKGNAAILIPIGTKRMFQVCAHLCGQYEWDEGIEVNADNLLGATRSKANGVCSITGMTAPIFSQVPLPVALVGTETEVFFNDLWHSPNPPAVRTIEAALAHVLGDQSNGVSCFWEG